MADTLNIRFISPSPAPGDPVGESIKLSGTIAASAGTLVFGTGQTNKDQPEGTLRLQFGADGPTVNATFSGPQWTCTGTVSLAARNGTPIQITASGAFSYIPPGHSAEEPEDIEGTATLGVIFSAPPPELFAYFSGKVIASTLPYLLKISGSVISRSPAGRIASVKYQLGSAPPLNVHDDSGDLSHWSAEIDLPASGNNSFTVTATDADIRYGATSQTSIVTIASPFPSTDINQVFEPTTYLGELLTFAKAQIITNDTTTVAPTPELLARQFFQPFDQLSLGPAYLEAIAPVRQTRIAIEVLRRHVNGAVPPVAVPADIDQRYRLIAYQAILRAVGTSYDELRLARVATAPARAALAARIGIAIGGARPDNLDQLTLLGKAISDAALESLFGYRSTSPADPLAAPPNAQPDLLIWQLAALRRSWQSDDEHTRDAVAGALPIIDPDVISAPNITIQTLDDPKSPFALWTARKNWTNATLAQITKDGTAQSDPLTLFDQIVLKYIGSITLADLAAIDANGGDISATLAGFYLDLDAFRFLALSRQLLSAGTLLDSEWNDVFAILVETQKRLQFRQWRLQEAGLVLEPTQFQANSAGPTPDMPQWRGSSQTYSDWQRTLQGRVGQSQTLQSELAAAVDSAETQTLPGLRDALLQVIGQQQNPADALNATAERLSRQLQIDFLTNGGPTTTRVNQAIDTLQGILFSARAGTATTAGTWTLNGSSSPAFDDAWVWMGSFNTWLAAIKVFAYPENQLSPSLCVADSVLTLTNAFQTLMSSLRNQATFTPDDAKGVASTYSTAVLKEVGASSFVIAAGLPLPDKLSDKGLVTRQALMKSWIDNWRGMLWTPTVTSPYLTFEAFWLVPMAIALRLQVDRQYLAALDWFRTVYAYNLPQDNRKIYYLLTLEESVIADYARDPLWLTAELNPHVIVRTLLDATANTEAGAPGRQNAYTSFTVLSIVRCLLAYADLQFSTGSAESVSEARTLYETAVDVLGQPLEVGTGTKPIFPPNPIWPPLLWHAQANLTKIRSGMNIAGVLLPESSDSATVFLPSQYPYSVLVNRAKNLVGIAEQVESSYLNALEQRDAQTYSVLQANNDIQVAAASLTLAGLKVVGAADSVTAAQDQQDKANVEYDHYDQLISDGLNDYEWATLGALAAATAFHVFDVFSDVKNLDPLAAAGSAASAGAQLAETKASYERREQEWQYQKSLAGQDIQIAGQQVTVAQNQQQIAQQEQQVAGQQLDHATEVLTFLSNKFTNAQLFEWMSGVLGQVYAYFLQQATAIAQLAEAQLAFERQTPPSGYIRSDYWQDTSGSANGTDREGLTGAERLSEDIEQLDEYAFQTDVRTLHLTQTMSVAQIAALELQQFRETGLLVFATPMSLFDQEFPGHYLRLIQSIQVSIVALVPAVRGVRGTLSASGLSRVIVPGSGQFQSVTLGRSPEAFSFTSPTNANGLFDQETDTAGLLLPFQGMGVDTVWQLELPKAANPFDYRTIADVQLTIKYTARNSYDYREAVLRSLDNTFSGDRTFSIRDDFPDAWYELNNPATVADPASQMKVTLAIGRNDFQPNVDELAVQQITLFCLRQDGVTQELNILSLAHTPTGGQVSTSTGTVQTIGGITGTRRPAGTPWLPIIGTDPGGDWTLQFEDTDPVRALFSNGSIQDIALALTVNGITPAWP